MKTLAIVLASLLFVSLRLFAGEVGENSKPECQKHKQESRSSIVEKDDKKDDKKEVKQELKGTSR